ncbi:hypothetical protein B0H17DRAFT_1142400 [Mycena rosella]|uniref:Secreted protein n=1 Tax=Mycena rosella TaxID=1033263 RepID=A0AAD7G9E2_MYCRO|nr:hypothetical protein B0H17DRAFT_1142400 [Mycena rosella]
MLLLPFHTMLLFHLSTSMATTTCFESTHFVMPADGPPGPYLRTIRNNGAVSLAWLDGVAVHWTAPGERQSTSASYIAWPKGTGCLVHASGDLHGGGDTSDLARWIRIYLAFTTSAGLIWCAVPRRYFPTLCYDWLSDFPRLLRSCSHHTTSEDSSRLDTRLTYAASACALDCHVR